MRLSKTTQVLAAAMALLPLAAAAHSGAEDHLHAGFMAGFVHPFTGLDHLAAMLAVGLWSALIARRAGPGLLWGPLGFAFMLMLGAVAGLQGMAITSVEPMIAASLLVCGLLVITRLRLNGPACAALVGSFAVFHGLAHGHELAASASTTSALVGMLSATLLLHTVGLGLGWSMRQANYWLPQIAGAGVALFGAVLLIRLA
jgi:urease accessory protein